MNVKSGRRSGSRIVQVVGIAVLAGLLLITGSEPKLARAEAESQGSIEFIGKNRMLTADGRFDSWKLTRVQIDRESPANSFVEVEVNIESLDTGIKRRDNHLRSDDFFDIQKFPTATVRVHSAIADGESERGHPQYRAKFDVKIRDIEKTLDGSFELVSDAPARVEGALVVNRLDFGVGKPYSKWNPMSIREEIPVNFSALIPLEAAGVGAGPESSSGEEVH